MRDEVEQEGVIDDVEQEDVDGRCGWKRWMEDVDGRCGWKMCIKEGQERWNGSDPSDGEHGENGGPIQAFW